MRRVDIDFIENKQRWWIWGFAVLLCLGVLIYLLQILEHTSQENFELEKNATALKKQIDGKKNKSTVEKNDPRKINFELVSKSLQWDANQVFGVVERLQETGAHLKGLSLDLSANGIKLEYELDSINVGSNVTSSLNSGYENSPWRLESLSGINLSGFAPMGGGVTSLFRGVWVAQINDL